MSRPPCVVWDGSSTLATCSMANEATTALLRSATPPVAPDIAYLLQGLGFASAVIDGGLAPHRPPGSLPKAHRAALAQAAGHFQLLFWRRGLRRGQEPPRLRLRHRFGAEGVLNCWWGSVSFASGFRGFCMVRGWWGATHLYAWIRLLHMAAKAAALWPCQPLL
jgi:hypothetical protein